MSKDYNPLDQWDDDYLQAELDRRKGIKPGKPLSIDGMPKHFESCFVVDLSVPPHGKSHARLHVWSNSPFDLASLLSGLVFPDTPEGRTGARDRAMRGMTEVPHTGWQAHANQLAREFMLAEELNQWDNFRTLMTSFLEKYSFQDDET